MKLLVIQNSELASLGVLTVRLVQLFAKNRKPILGICLGAQIIARAFGQRIYQHHTVELGFTPLRLIHAAVADDSVFQTWAQNYLEPIYLMEWHFDTFDLPAQATLLMSGDRCQNQVYRIHTNIYGFQCHMEVNHAILQDWVADGKDYLQQNHPDFSERLVQQAEAYLSQSAAFCRSVCHAWLDLVAFQCCAKVQ